jgi:hypothetical protein
MGKRDWASAFGLNREADSYVRDVASALIDGASSVDDGDVRPEAITALCDVLATIAVQYIDIRSIGGRRAVAEACRVRILERMRLIAESLDDQGAIQVHDLFGVRKPLTLGRPSLSW